jgi:hypothetical protein
MRLEEALRKSPCGAARRLNNRGRFTTAMKIRGELRRIASVENPCSQGPMRQFELTSDDWTPCMGVKEKTN